MAFSLDFPKRMNRAFGEGETQVERRGSLWSRSVALDIVAFLDAGAVAAGVVVPALLFANWGGADVMAHSVAQAGLIAALVAHLCLRSAQFYPERQIHRLPLRAGDLCIALVIGVAASLGIGLPFSPLSPEAAAWYACWLASSFTFVFFNRIVTSAVLRKLAVGGRFNMRIAVYGAGPVARRVHDYLADGPAGLGLIGVFDDRENGRKISEEGLTISGSLDDLVAAGRMGEIDQILIALPQTADRRIAGIARRLEQLPISLHVVTHLASDLIDPQARHNVSSLGPLGLLDVRAHPHADWSPIAKRAEDLLLGGVLFVILFPLLLLIAALIRLDSPGPALFVQRRRGMNRRTIQVYKFRTMDVQEDGDRILQARSDDERVTRFGRWLRRSSLDELPQLWNVLRGEMSLVGPRPHAVAHDDQWGAMIDRYQNRHQVKPGITGLAQIEGARGEIAEEGDLRRRVEADLEYIANWSVALDLSIIAKTLWALVKGTNAH